MMRGVLEERVMQSFPGTIARFLFPVYFVY
jgi:hypothetical protein